jgi:hypothetical protein
MKMIHNDRKISQIILQAKYKSRFTIFFLNLKTTCLKHV